MQRLAVGADRFARDEAGSATIWNLTWLAGFGIMAGLAVDSTNAWRHKTMMATTADAAATAGAWSLPLPHLDIDYGEGNYSATKDKAFAFATANMSREDHGAYILRDGEAADGGPGDIHIGHWDFGGREFVPGASITDPEAQPVNAVHVRLSRNTDRFNNVQTTLLQLAGFSLWDIGVASTAVLGENRCLASGIIARGEVRVRSSGAVFGQSCLHGHMGVEIAPGTYWDTADGLVATTGDPDSPARLADLTGSEHLGRWLVPEPQYDGQGNPIAVPDGTERQEAGLYPLYVDSVPLIASRMLTGAPGFHDWVYPTRPAAGASTPPEVIVLPEGFSIVQGTVPFDHILPAHEAVPNAYQTAGVVPTAQYEDLDGPWIDPEENNWPRDDTALVFEDGTVDFAELASLSGLPDASGESFEVASATASPLPDHRIYFAPDCGPAETLILSGEIQNTTFVTSCRLVIGDGAIVQNVVALTTADGEVGEGELSTAVASPPALQIGIGAELGIPGCTGGGVRLFSNGDIEIGDVTVDALARPALYNATMFARADIHVAAESSSHRLLLHAGDDIIFDEVAGIGALDGSDDTAGPCPDGVSGVPKSQKSYTVAIVD